VSTRIRRNAASILGIACLVLAACGNQVSGTPSKGGTATIDNETGSLWTCGFNPFQANVNFTSLGILYEPLVQINGLNGGKETPWLASSWSWNQSATVLTFSLRPGVKWSDGQPLTAGDVVYTFNLMKDHSALDLQAVWSVLDKVEKQGDDKVVMTFKQASLPYFYFVADQVGIVSEHVWSKVSDPTTYQDQQPVGTGPFTVSQCTPQNISYTRNANYWQPGKPYLDKVNYPAFESNDPANLTLAAGKAEWGGQFIPNIDTFYVKGNPDRHYWFPPTNNVYLWMNLTVAPFNNQAFRQALAYAIDRPQVAKRGEFGYQPPANQSGVVTPTFQSWYNASQAAKFDYKFDPQKANSMLDSAGFKRGSSGLRQTPVGKPLSFSIINISGFSDWVASVDVIKADLQQVGIELKPNNLSSQDYYNKWYTGDFELAYGSEQSVGQPGPYYEFRNVLYSANTAPIGQTAATNFERYSSKKVDSLIEGFASASSSGQQHDIINQLQQVMLEEVPVIPVTEAVAWYQYDTSKLAGWPTRENPYANPAPGTFPDLEVVLINLHKK
jgi:peptide/nickel transport system substrate-binding protein